MYTQSEQTEPECATFYIWLVTLSDKCSALSSSSVDIATVSADYCIISATRVSQWLLPATAVEIHKQRLNEQ